MAWIHYTECRAVCTKTLKGLSQVKISKKLKYFWFSHILWAYLTRKTCGQHWFTSLNIWDTLWHLNLNDTCYCKCFWIEQWYLIFVALECDDVFSSWNSFASLLFLHVDTKSPIHLRVSKLLEHLHHFCSEILFLPQMRSKQSS